MTTFQARPLTRRSVANREQSSCRSELWREVRRVAGGGDVATGR